MADVLFFAEQRGGSLRRAAFEAATAARSLANGLGGKVHALVAAESGAAGMAGELAKYGADVVHTIDHAAFAASNGRAVAEAAVSVAKDVGAEIVLFTSSSLGKDAGPRAAALFDAGYIPDAIELSVADGKPVAVKPMYSGKVRTTIESAGGPCVIGVRPNAFTPSEAAGAGEVTTATFTPSELASAVTVKSFNASDGGKVDLAEATRVVSGGRGMKGPENFPIVQALADAIGGAMGASRAAVDAGWIDHSHQVGQTGRTVSPDLYIACGISGAIQHLAGMSSSRVIVAINKDPEAPIFNVCDYGIVGDLFEIVPAMTEKARAMLAE